MFKNIIKVDHKIQSCIIFGQIGLVYAFFYYHYFFLGGGGGGGGGWGWVGGGIDFCQSVVPHHTKMIKLKTSLKIIMRCKVL